MNNFGTFIMRELIYSIFNSKKGLNMLKGLNVVGCFIIDYKNNEINISRQLLKMINEKDENRKININECCKKYIYPEDVKKIRQEFLEQAKSREFKFIEFRLNTDSGDKWVKVIGRYIYNRKGEIIKLRAAIQDITELKEKELKLRVDLIERKKNEKKLNSLVRLRESVLEISHGIMEISDINELLNIILNRALKSIRNGQIGTVLILDENQILKAKAYRGFKRSEIEELKIKLEESFIYIVTKGEIKETVIINNIEGMAVDNKKYTLDNDDALYIRSSISAPIFVNDKLYGFLNVDSENKDVFDDSDIELMEYLRLQVSMAIEKHQLYEKTIQFSRYDELTGVFNRRYFEERLNIQLEKSRRYNEKFCFVLFDLNKFKHINDNYGHLAGDEVLKDFTNRLKNNFRSSDIIGRFGGDEFVALIYNVEVDEVINKVQNILKELKKHSLEFNGNTITYGFSYGVSSFTNMTKDFNALLKEADIKMYENKNNNR